MAFESSRNCRVTSLAEVRDAAGHSNISITSDYLHVAVVDEGELGNLFDL